jgi:hypothetical protein
VHSHGYCLMTPRSLVPFQSINPSHPSPRDTDETMSDQKPSKSAQPPLVDQFLQTGKFAFDPDRSENEKSASRDQFNLLIAR